MKKEGKSMFQLRALTPHFKSNKHTNSWILFPMHNCIYLKDLSRLCNWLGLTYWFFYPSKKMINKVNRTSSSGTESISALNYWLQVVFFWKAFELMQHSKKPRSIKKTETVEHKMFSSIGWCTVFGLRNVSNHWNIIL